MASKQEEPKPLSLVQNTAIGMISGAIEVGIMQPTVAIKNMLQQNKPLNYSPAVLYRGVGINVMSLAPITGIQFGVNGTLLNAFPELQKTAAGQMFCAGSAGVFSGLASGPAELIMILQQRTGQSLGATASQIMKADGAMGLYRGFSLAAVRDGTWASAYLALGPVVSSQLHTSFPQTFGTQDDATPSQKGSALITGSILAGLFTVGITQPIDTVKTVVQGETFEANRRGALQETKELYKEHGLSFFYRGTVPRGGRLIGAVFIYNECKKILEAKFRDHNILAFD